MANTTQSALQLATQLASKGQYAEAEAILDTIEENSIPVLLLRAKIQAQQGQFDAAINNFQKVLTMQPTNKDAQEGLNLATQMKGKPASHFYLRTNLHFAALYLIITILGVSLVIVSMNASTTPDQTLSFAIKTAQENQLALGRQMTDVIKTTQAAYDQRNAQLVALFKAQLSELQQNDQRLEASSQKHWGQLNRQLRQLVTVVEDNRRQIKTAQARYEQGNTQLAAIETQLSESRQNGQQQQARSQKELAQLATAVEESNRQLKASLAGLKETFNTTHQQILEKVGVLENRLEEIKPTTPTPKQPNTNQ